MSKAVIVVDMQNGFLREDGTLFCGRLARKIIPNVFELLKKESEEGSTIFFTQDTHDPDDKEFDMFPPHCISGTEEVEIIDELDGIDGTIIQKRRYSGFFETHLQEYIQDVEDLDEVIVCGVCTDICVLHTVAGLRNLDIPVTVPADCVASFNAVNHEFALDHMEQILGATVKHRNTYRTSAPTIAGTNADIYFHRTQEILSALGRDPSVTAEIFTRKTNIKLCGMNEVHALLRQVLGPNSEVETLQEGDIVTRVKEPVLRIRAPYSEIGVYETAILGILSSSTGWATAAMECVLAADGIPVTSFGARHIHPEISGRMEYASIVGGCQSSATEQGATLGGKLPVGTMPHALMLCLGDTLEAAKAFDKHIDDSVKRVVLVDTFKDEVEESLRIADELGDKLWGVRLDTPSERGGVTPGLVKELRAKLDAAGCHWVKILVSGGLTPERIKLFKAEGAPVDSIGVGSYISGATPIDFTMDLKEVNGKEVAKRGRIPGLTGNPRLKILGDLGTSGINYKQVTHDLGLE